MAQGRNPVKLCVPTSLPSQAPEVAVIPTVEGRCDLKARLTHLCSFENWDPGGAPSEVSSQSSPGQVTTKGPIKINPLHSSRS